MRIMLPIGSELFSGMNDRSRTMFVKGQKEYSESWVKRTDFYIQTAVQSQWLVVSDGEI
jgi:hypothetical protein